MSTPFENFKTLHRQNELFVLPNAWDARSAIIFQEKKFPAIGTSSAAVANSLGYEDGEQMSFSEYLFVVNRIISTVKIPLTVDIEMGYGKNNEEIFGNVLRLIELGVAGINIEDSIIQNSKRVLKDANTFASTIEYIKNKLESKNQRLFINIRCDTYILNVDNKRQETVNRLKIYNTTGADGIFLPCITNEEDIAEAVANTPLPLNVMCIPGLPSLEILNRLGVKRVSMGPFMFQKVYKNIGILSEAIMTDKSLLPILA
jgi:2-methylisocitrate lyase-like PEP mutase family enzyme